jgi:4-coumarate--CoA ligase
MRGKTALTFVLPKTGGVVSGASPAYNVDEMVYALKTADAKILMTMPTSMKVAAAAAERAGIPQSRVFLLEGELDGYTNMQELLKIGRSYESQVPAFQLPAGKKNGDLCGFLSFSSGTTGLPKAVSLMEPHALSNSTSRHCVRVSMRVTN